MPGCADAGPRDDAREAMKHGEYEIAFNIWAPLAEQGDAEAQNELGLMYASGQGMPGVDGNEAVKWLTRSADQGNTTAAVNLGLLHLRGRVLPRDAVAAAAWFRTAGERGSAAGARLLADLYRSGRDGVPKDAPEAVAWYRKAMEQGDLEAQVSLGGMYGSGSGVEQDRAEEMRLYCNAAERGSAWADLMIAHTHLQSGSRPDEALLMAWLHQAADHGERLAQDNLALMYAFRQDHVQAYKWLSLSMREYAGGYRDWMAGRLASLSAAMSREQIAAAEKLVREWRINPVPSKCGE